MKLSPQSILNKANHYRWQMPHNLHDQIAESIYAEAARISTTTISSSGTSTRKVWQQKLDQILTNPWSAYPAMTLVLAAILWLTIVGANYPSELLSYALVDVGHAKLSSLCTALNAPAWIKGLMVDGMYLATAWVIAVMLPPMAIFFPCFTLLEDFGFLPRVAFNLDRIFQKAGAHGKQSLTMAMGLGCNAAGVIATRIIDSPRERLIAILTNNFSLCNGRWPTQILIATIFIGASAPTGWKTSIAAASVLAVALLGFGFALLSSWFLAKTFLKGEATSFSLELPPYRPPQFFKTLYTSLIDRTIIVLWRAVLFALPSGALIWLCANIHFQNHSLAQWFCMGTNPLANCFGLTGVILLAYIIAIPANEIIVPTILMLTVHTLHMANTNPDGVMMDVDPSMVHQILSQGGWTTLTAICFMLFSLCHNPCSTTIVTIYKETRSYRWTFLAVILPLFLGFALCFILSSLWKFCA